MQPWHEWSVTSGNQNQHNQHDFALVNPGIMQRSWESNDNKAS